MHSGSRTRVSMAAAPQIRRRTALSAPQRTDRRAGRLQAGGKVGLWILGMLLVFQGQATVVLPPGQGLEQVHGAQVALPQDGEGLRTLHVLEVDPEDPRAEDLDGTDRILARAEEV